MVHITHIQTNIKFPGSVCLSGLSPNILITGPNASGKTALINAVELALTGEVRDIGGRDKAKSSTILQGLLHPKEDSLFAVIKLSNGQTASWVMERGKRPVHTPIDGNVHFLLPEVMGMLKGSKAVVARFLVKYFGYGPIGENVDYGPFGDLHAAPTTSLPLLAVEEDARKAAASHTAEARALKLALSKLGVSAGSAAEHAGKVVVLSSIISLLSWQVEHNLDTCGVCASKVEMNALGGRLAQAQAQLDRLGGPQSSERVETLQQAFESAERQAAACKQIATDCMEAMYSFVEEAKERICLQITECLPADFPNHVGIEVSKGSILTGFYNPAEEFLRPHVSGAELITLCTAIGGAVAKRLPVNDLVVLTTPDRALDLDYLRRLLAMMKLVPAVTIVQSPFQPRGRPSVNWTRVVLEGDGAITIHGESTEVYSATAG